MSRFATLTLKVTVELEEDPGLMTPDAHEPPYEYLAVREVEFSDAELHGDAATVALIDFGGTEDLDPDELLVSEVGKALRSLTTSPLEIEGEQ